MKKYRIIIAGPRWFADYERVKSEVRYLTRNMVDEEIEIISGGCDASKDGVLTYTRADGSKVYGADGLGERLAEENGWALKVFMADWKQLGKAAGPIRNTAMARYATHSLCFDDGKSRGTGDMIKKSENIGLIGSAVTIGGRDDERSATRDDASSTDEQNEILVGEEFMKWAEQYWRLREIVTIKDPDSFAGEVCDYDYMRGVFINKIDSLIKENLHPSPKPTSLNSIK